MKTKRITALIIALLMMAAAFVGCSSDDGEKSESDAKLKIVATIFPEYDWVLNILGERAEDVSDEFLLCDGGDMHSFQPS
ncbi:MAG: zinc ABC transporter substrate-binding protein, partial [Clostridia bacterium]|nr:zinc ABC transporter substrate-binding protein [Clostridia bacterium]